VANKPGVLVRIALVFARRGYNINSLVVSPTINPKFSRITMTAKGDLETLEQIIRTSISSLMSSIAKNTRNTVEKELPFSRPRPPPQSRHS